MDFYNVPKDELKYIEENRNVGNYYLSEELGYSYLPDLKTLTESNTKEKPLVNVISTRINEKFKTNYSVGDTITLDIGESEENIVNMTTKTYKIVGIINRPTTAIEPYEVEWFTMITKMQKINKQNIIETIRNDNI